MFYPQDILIIKKLFFKINNKVFILTCFFFLTFNFSFPINSIHAQQFYRIKVDYSVKQKDFSGKKMLQVGKIFYDINSQAIVIKSTIPTQELIVQQDDYLYRLENGKVVNKLKYMVPVKFSVFHLALTGKLENFGLDNLGYRMEEIKKEKGLVMSSWIPKKNKFFGKILISTKNKQLFGIVFLSSENKVLAKHFYRKYTNIQGFMFPTEILRINYVNDKESYELTSYNNIRLNEINRNEEYYQLKVIF